MGSYPRANPYVRPTGGAPTPYVQGSASPYARPAQDAQPPVDTETDPIAGYSARSVTQGAPEAKAMPDAGVTPPVNPYAAPVPTVNPYAKASPTNPYAAAKTAFPAEGEEPTNPSPRRTSRSSRYQGHDDTPES
jgi:hypothetical protein